VGAGAKILGGFTVGDNARIGSNAVVVREVPENVTVVGVPARSTKETKKQREQLHSQFMAYGVVPGEDDPYVVKIRQLERQLQQQAQMIAQLQKLAGIDGDEKDEEKGAETK
jgi:serine O-acetyltransferase